MLKKSSISAVAIAALLWAGSAFAHAHVVSSTPKPNDTIVTPDDVTIKFSEALHVDESSIKVYNAKGKAMNDGKLKLAAKDNTAVTAIMPILKPGRYKVKWKAVCMCNDHHKTSGSYSFNVK